MIDFGGKIRGNLWMKDGETWGNQANPWIKINKTSSCQQITKKIWWGNFELGRKTTRSKLENEY